MEIADVNVPMKIPSFLGDFPAMWLMTGGWTSLSPWGPIRGATVKARAHDVSATEAARGITRNVVEAIIKASPGLTTKRETIG